MSNAIIQQTFQNKYEEKSKLEKKWQDFINQDTYLISDKKLRFSDDIIQITKFPRVSFFNFKVRRFLTS
ncbi:MAG: hypothetical protein CEE43_05195 [Promethearchaeota archaeon Loki_b32]|nr:MAG: hypothetical protein CEE43_05195 [Candidatus Lokiarchaeota archaeon Loki_b32]